MNRSKAKIIAENVTASDLKEMFINAKEKIKDWTKVSCVNKGLTKGTAFNILSKGTIDDKTPLIAKINMVSEFGEYLPNYVKPEKKSKPKVTPTHWEPDFEFEW